jgi:hypothetical protein
MGVLFKRRSSDDDHMTTSLLRHGVYRLSDVEDEEIKKFNGATSAYSFWSAVKYISILTILLWWLPIFGQMIAGYVGGRRAGTPGKAVIAAMIPLIAIFAITLAFDSGLLPSYVNGVAINPQALFSNIENTVPFIGPYLTFVTMYIGNLMGAVQSITLLRVDNYIVTVAFAYIGGIIADQTRRELEFVASHGGHETNVIVERDHAKDEAPIRKRALRYTKPSSPLIDEESSFESMRSLSGDADLSEAEPEQPVRTTKKLMARRAEQEESPKGRRMVNHKVKELEKEQRKVEKKVKQKNSGPAAGLIARSTKSSKPRSKTADKDDESRGWEYI